MASSWPTVRLLLVLLALISLSCGSKRDQPTGQTSPSSVVTSIPPFKTKEPETYQAVRSITFTSDLGQSNASTTTVSREGDKRREEDNSRNKRVVYLYVSAGNFVLLPDEKIYAEAVGPTASTLTPEAFEEVYVHAAPIQSTYENLGAQTVNGINTTKYKVTVNSSHAGNVSQSETLIWIDEALGIPIKSVTRSPAGTRTMELTQITLNVDKNQFEIPKDYQKVEMQVLQQRIR